eukprot:1150933-Pelagomonas_calceolata.AAC.3
MPHHGAHLPAKIQKGSISAIALADDAFIDSFIARNRQLLRNSYELLSGVCICVQLCVCQQQADLANITDSMVEVRENSHKGILAKAKAVQA